MGTKKTKILPDYDELLQANKKLEAAASRQLVVQRDLNAAKERIDQELSRYQVLQEYVNRFLSADLEDDGITLTLEYLIEAFELEVSFLLCCCDTPGRMLVAGQFGLEEIPEHLQFDDEWFNNDDSVVVTDDHPLLLAWSELNLAQAIYCPYFGKDQSLRGTLVGAITRDGLDYFNAIDPEMKSAYTIMVRQAGMLWMSRELNEEITQRNQELVGLTDSYSRFVPFEFIDLLQRESIQHVHEGDHADLEMDVMFADLRGFTRMAEKLGSEAVFKLLNEYLAQMEPCIASKNGFINQYQGDAIMALFSGGADNAVNGVIDMFRALDGLNKRREERQEELLRIGVGINSGPLLLGAIGSRMRLDSNVVGDTANLASRVENMTKVYGARTLLADSTVKGITNPGQFSLRELDRVIVAGKSEPVIIYELLDVDPAVVRDQKIASLDRFAEGLDAYRRGKFRDARLIFADCLVRAPLDEAAALYIGRCVNLIAEPPIGQWNGITVLKGK